MKYKKIAPKNMPDVKWFVEPSATLAHNSVVRSGGSQIGPLRRPLHHVKGAMQVRNGNSVGNNKAVCHVKVRQLWKVGKPAYRLLLEKTLW